ncbi:unnamed protein product [Dibothriocephalus latus]|uniref:Uncharacterized protein n=1 Tax=Dibothriocephalus latus TaxID=60516 RepID=A0A3P7Q6U7_DIBLA|nr:unnamed protein product [Dibothriocephalus latus]
MSPVAYSQSVKYCTFIGFELWLGQDQDSRGLNPTVGMGRESTYCADMVDVIRYSGVVRYVDREGFESCRPTYLMPPDTKSLG